MREASRRCGIFLRDTSRSQPARHRARAKQARVLRLLPRDSERRRACAARATRRWLEVLGSSWHAALRSCAKGEKYLAGVAPFSRVSADQDQRSTARAQQGRVLRLLPRHSERRRASVARATRRWHEAAGCSWHVAPRSRAKGEESLAAVASFGRVRADHNHRGTTHTLSKLECCASS